MADNIDKLRALEKERQANIAKREAAMEARKKQEQEEARRKREKIADAMQLTPEERREYLGDVAPPAPKIPAMEKLASQPTPTTPTAPSPVPTPKKAAPSPSKPSVPEAGRGSGKKDDRPPPPPPEDPERQKVTDAEKAVTTLLEKITAARAKSANPADQEEFDQAEHEAQRLYNERADRSEWLSLADRVGNAITRIGAARAGLKSGVDMSKIDYGPGYDATASEKRAARDYEMSLGNTGRRRKQATDNQKLEQDRLDREAAAEMPSLDFAKYKFGQETDTYQQDRRDTAAEKRRELELRSTEARQAARDKATEDRAAKRAGESEDKQLRALRVADLQKQLAGEEKQGSAVIRGSQLIANLPDLSKKSVDRLMAGYPQVMGDAGITPEQLASIEERSTKQGWFGSSVDPKERQKLIQEELIKPKQERIRNLRQALDSVLSSSKKPVEQTSEEPKTLLMRHKQSGAEREVTPEEAAKLPKDQFEEVR